MKKYGLIGRRLGHSWSQRWFEEMFRREKVAAASYSLFEMESVDGLREWVENHAISGFNVTVPYKEAVIPFLDDLDETASAVGAVNCVEVCDGRLVGHNTDAPAFRDTLAPLLRSWHSSALILGTGGAAKAVAFALRQLEIDYCFVSRNPNGRAGIVGYDGAREMACERLLIVNATPVGMYPDVGQTPWPYLADLGEHHVCYDLIYNPAESRFLHDARSKGCQTANGLAMLHRQAQLSWEIWSGR